MNFRSRLTLALLAVCLSPAIARSEDAGERQEAYWAAVRKVYNQRVTLSFDDKPLAEIAALLSSQVGLPVLIDHYALDDHGIDASDTLSGHFESLPLHQVISLLLKPIEWACIYDIDCLVLTSQYEEESRLKVRVYPVGDLLDRNCFDFDSLIDVVVSTVASESWAENGGGEAEIRPLLIADVLIVSQTVPVHLEIEALLASIRWAMRVQQIPPGGAGRRVPCEPAEPWQKFPGMGAGGGGGAWAGAGAWTSDGPTGEPAPAEEKPQASSPQPE